MSRFRPAWFKLPSIGYHQVLIIITLISAAFWGLVLAGCSTSTRSIPNIYILSASYASSDTLSSSNSNSLEPIYLASLRNLTQRARLDVRAGFFSQCVRIPTAIQGQSSWDCGTKDALMGRYGGSDIDPMGLIAYMDAFVNRVVFYGLIIGSLTLQLVVVGLLSTFPGWRSEIDDEGDEHEVKPFPSRPVSQLAMYFAVFATLFGFVSMLWIQVAAVAFAESLDQLLRGLVVTSIGPAVMCLGWAAVGLLGIVALGLFVMILSIQLLDRLTDED